MEKLLDDFIRLEEVLEGLRKDVDNLTAISDRLREETNKLSYKIER
ncbi:hypothetical protein [Fictibacillus arsenicus]|nr:hypothetical protein [Fictibacillus arsenicus]